MYRLFWCPQNIQRQPRASGAWRQAAAVRFPQILIVAGAAALLLLAVATPAWAVDFFWNNSGGGQFTKPGNWLPAVGGPGGAGDTVHFDLGIAPTDRYIVTDVGGEKDIGRENDRLLIHNDSLSLVVSNDYTLLRPGLDFSDASLVVGAGSGDNADVILTGSGVLRTQDSSIGQQGGAGVVTVDNLQWVNNQLLIVGNFQGTGTLTIQAGASVSAPLSRIGLGGAGTVTVDGSGSSWTNGGELGVGDNISFIGNGTLTILNGGSVSNSNGFVGSTAPLSNPGTGAVTVSGAGSTWTNNGNLSLGDGPDTGTLSVADGALVHVAGELSITGPSTVNLDGGTLRFNGYSRNGTFNYVSGTIQLAGDRTVGSDAAIADLFGATPTLGSGKGLTIEGAASIQTDLTLDGGTLRTGQLVDGGGQLIWTKGTLHITGAGGLTIGPTPLFGSTLVLTQHHSLEIDHALTIDGGATLIAASGLQAGSAVVTSGGQLFASGATHDFGSGLTNHGDLVLSNTTIDGPVTNATGANVTAIGNVTFNDLVDGPGGFFGPGVTTFNGGYNPGASPGVVPFEGHIALGAANTLAIELAGMLDGQFDRLNVLGDAQLDGALAVSLLDGFELAANQSFTILDVGGALTGLFDGLGEGELVGNFGDTDLWITYAGGDGNDVALFTAAPSFAADFDEDGDVDGDDLANWKTGFGDTTAVHMDGDADGDQDVDGGDFLAWQRRLGEGASALAARASVPEPTPLGLATMLAPLMRGRRHGRKS